VHVSSNVYSELATKTHALLLLRGKDRPRRSRSVAGVHPGALSREGPVAPVALPRVAAVGRWLELVICGWNSKVA
jgi:hypothetical protein